MFSTSDTECGLTIYLGKTAAGAAGVDTASWKDHVAYTEGSAVEFSNLEQYFTSQGSILELYIRAKTDGNVERAKKVKLNLSANYPNTKPTIAGLLPALEV